MIGLCTMPLHECSIVATRGFTVLYPVLVPVVCSMRAIGSRLKLLPLDWTEIAMT